MTETQKIEENQQIVEQPTLTKGKVVSIFQDKRALSHPAPLWLIVVMDTVINMNASGDIILNSINHVHTSFLHVANIVLGVATLVCTSLKKAIGVIPTNNQ